MKSSACSLRVFSPIGPWEAALSGGGGTLYTCQRDSCSLPGTAAAALCAGETQLRRHTDSMLRDSAVYRTLWLRELCAERECQRVRLLGVLVQRVEHPNGALTCVLDDSTGMCACRMPAGVCGPFRSLPLGAAVEVLGEIRPGSSEVAVRHAVHQPDPMYEVLRWRTLIEQRRAAPPSLAEPALLGEALLPPSPLRPSVATGCGGGVSHALPQPLDVRTECLRIIAAAGASGTFFDAIAAELACSAMDRGTVAAVLGDLECNFEVYTNQQGAYLQM